MKNIFSLICMVALFAACFSPPTELNAQVCATYCPSQQATANVTSIAGATYAWTITGPEVLTFAGQGTSAITIGSVGITEGQYLITVVVSPPGPLVCTADTACLFDVTQPLGVATLSDICRDAGLTSFTSIATTLTPSGGTFTYVNPVTGLPVTSADFDPGLFTSGTIAVTYTVIAGLCNIVVNTTIVIGDPPSISPGIIMG